MIENFGRNIRFQPAAVASPRSEEQLLETLAGHDGRFRALGAGHAWSPLIETDQLLVDLRRMNEVKVWQDASGQWWAEAGGGCRVKRLLAELRGHGVTLPSVGLITEQAIAGAISTGTHGSGRHSLSHYMDEVRLAVCDQQGRPGIVTAQHGDLLRAARCGLGALGMITSVRFRCVPQYLVEERLQWCDLQAAIEGEAEWPLQQFFLMPDGRRWLAQRRRVAERTRASWHAPLYHGYWFGAIDVGLHSTLKLLLGGLRSRRLAGAFMKHVVPWTVITNWQVRDRSDRMLVMEHELFRHLETEVFVPRPQLPAAARLLAAMFAFLDRGEALDRQSEQTLDDTAALEPLRRLRGEYAHHYPVCIRKVQGDDTLISMAAGDETWYAISLITYARQRDSFYRFAECVSQAMAAAFGARLHWGKHLALAPQQLTAAYPRWSEFLALRQQLDPQRRFSNALVDSLLDVGGEAVGEPA